jgi:hypothetical protein
MPPIAVWLLLAALFAVCVWGFRTWDCTDELSAGERRVLDALTRIWERRR